MGRQSIGPEERAERSAKMKRHWDTIRALVVILDRRSSDINGCHSRLKSEGVIDAIGKKDTRGQAILRARAIIDERNAPHVPAPSSRATGKKYRPRKPYKANDDPPDAMGRLRICLWAIRECGGVDKAEAAWALALDVASEAEATDAVEAARTETATAAKEAGPVDQATQEAEQ